MKILTWNVRGLNAPNKKRLIERGLKKGQVEIVLLQETKMNEEEIKIFKKGLGF